ncbi:MAG: Nif3-like dinuclear metal center hexameric protein, partial [Gemmatimonadaceae bacterium]|nr:Nif3-like dinuclear metal center hexameric protein [Gemmatimonadaceae bacterium]
MRFSTARALVGALVLAACGGTGGDAPARNDDAATTDFRVALLTPGAITDQAWNGGAYKGLERIRDSLGAKISHVQTRTPAEFDENFRLYGEQGYTLVFGHGFEYQDAASRVAPEFPKTIYATTSGNRTGANLAGLEFAFEDGSYLAGMLAGAITKSNRIGAIGGQEIPPVKRSFYAFEQGAKAVNPKVEVVSSFIGNWDDASAGKEQALAQIRRGVDVIFQNADAAGLGIFQAARENPTVRVFGANADQNGVAPEVTIASVVIDLPHAFLAPRHLARPGRGRRAPRDQPAPRGHRPGSHEGRDRLGPRADDQGHVPRTAPAHRSRRPVTTCGVPAREMADELDALLDLPSTPDYAGALNGLQVDHGGRVHGVAAAVDASLEAIEATVAAGANLLLVHHGLFWGGAQAVRGVHYRKLKTLLDHDVAVYAAHLPLDRHAVHGNNVLLARALALEPSGTWHEYKGVAIGVTADTDVATDDLVARARAFAGAHDHHVVVAGSHPGRRTRRVAICTGGGA